MPGRLHQWFRLERDANAIEKRMYDIHATHTRWNAVELKAAQGIGGSSDVGPFDHKHRAAKNAAMETVYCEPLDRCRSRICLRRLGQGIDLTPTIAVANKIRASRRYCLVEYRAFNALSVSVFQAWAWSKLQR